MDTQPMKPGPGWSSLLCLCLLAAITTPVTGAEEQASTPVWTLGAEVDANNRYLWRGMAFSEGAVYQPSLNLGRGVWSVNAWANVDPNVLVGPQLNELDATLSASTEWRGWSFEPSAMVYSYPGTGSAVTAEAQLGIRRAFGAWTPYTIHSVDLIEARGAAYSALGVSFERPIFRDSNVELNAEYGRGWWRFASSYADPALEGMNVWSAGLSSTIALADGVSLRPHVGWNQVGNRQVREFISGPSPFTFGFALGREF